MSMRVNPTKENASLERGGFSATGQKHDTDITSEKKLWTIRAKLCLAGGQTLHMATDGAFFVVTPWQQVTKFDDLNALQAYIQKVSA